MILKLIKPAIISVAFFMVLLLLAYTFVPKPEIKSFIPYSSAYFDRNGSLLRLSLAADSRYRLYQPLDSYAASVIDATILYEDQYFYEHHGVDFFAIMRAAWNTYVKRSRKIGASTITMQFARLRWKISSNTVGGKIKQIIRALQISRHYSKAEVLDAYLNIAPYGGNIEGVAAASLIYFNKKPSELSLHEALTLAVIPQNPNKRNPSVAANKKFVKAARARLLQRWLEKYPNDSRKAKQFELPLAIRSIRELPFKAPHFIDHLENQTSQWEHGYVQTSLDINKQRSIETIVKNYISQKKAEGIKNAAAILVNYKTMQIEAMLGSANFYDNTIHGQVNGVLAKRSPGSTLKPFVYALAIDEGLIHPLSLLKDSPRRFGGFTPQNYDKQFLGPISAKNALIESRNVPAVNLQARLKQRTFYQFLIDVGIKRLKGEQHYGLALALGGGEVTMLELVQMYAMLANEGINKMPQSLIHPSSDVLQKRMLSPESSFLILDMLKDNPAPAEIEALNPDQQLNQVAWKTGTSWAFRDAWAVGVSGDYALAVWVGNFDSSSNDAFIGRSAAGPLMFSIFRSINADIGWQISDLISPETLNLKQLDVCLETGDLLEKHCQTQTKAWFIPGVSPIKVSNVYRNIPINKKTGLRACFHQYGVTEMAVYEFWPSDFSQIFNQAGISRKKPPAYQEDCDLADKSASGQAPKISSPQQHLEYKINPAAKNSHLIPFKAIVDTDVKTLHWFVGNEYVGSVENNTALIWKAQPGKFLVKAVDDSGRSASKLITVTQVQ